MKPVLIAAALAVFAAAPARAAPDPLHVLDAAVMPTPPGAPTASAHLVIVNSGARDDRLMAAASPDAARVEIHRMDMAGGVMRMRPAGPLAVPAHGRLEVSPASGLHLMLIGPKRRLASGQTVTLELTFARAGRRVVHAPVAAGR